MASSIEITVPDSAEEGATVPVSVEIKNVSEFHYSFRTEIYANVDLLLSKDATIPSGWTKTYDTSFIMPAVEVTILVWVERWSFDHWEYDNSASRIVSLKIPVPETFHLSVFVPPWAAGGYVEPGSGDYPAYSTVRLTAHPLSGYQFTSWGGDASGTSPTYNLYMDSDKYVEAYFEKVPVPEYAGTISRKELEYDHVRSSIPVY